MAEKDKRAFWMKMYTKTFKLMGKRQNVLANILHQNNVTLCPPVIVNKEIFYSSEFDKEIKSVYKSLGGLLNEYPVNFGNFDIVTSNCFIELDEGKTINNIYN